jgi:hypothetical protein
MRWGPLLFCIFTASIVAACGPATERPSSSSRGVAAPAAWSEAYRAVQERLTRGWNTWDSPSVLRHVRLPEGFAIDLAFKQHAWIEERYLRTALIGRTAPDAERVRPGPHALDGSYTALDLAWQQLDARVESGHDGDDLVVLITPRAASNPPVSLVVHSAMLWNRDAALARDAEGLRAEWPGGGERVFATGSHVDDPFVPASTPYLVLPLARPVGLSTGRRRTVAEIRAALDARASELDARHQRFGPLAEAAAAVEAGLAWNLVYEPKHGRVVPTVGRQWNEEYGGYALFGWDNFFLAYAASLFDENLAVAGVVEHLAGRTDEGFVPNDHAGNGRKSFDRSQPPVGGLMVAALVERVETPWLADAAFEPLVEWNRWWVRRRLNDGLLSYGSHEAPNPFDEPNRQSMVTAGYESGMDDSPMYDGVPFDRATSTMALQDVGLSSLYVADCDSLALLADRLGRTAEAEELRERAAGVRRAMERLWSEEVGLYLNRRTDTGELSRRRSPTLFYPLLAAVPGPERARRMIDDHLLDPAAFWGEYVLPSIARDDPVFPQQRYWKGAIWPPLNFLTYLALDRQGETRARAALAERSLALFRAEWRRKGYVSENYSAFTGTGDDARLSSDRFHSWGVLMALPAFIEAGHLHAPKLDP